MLAGVTVGLVEPPDQKQSPRLEIARMGGVRPVALSSALSRLEATYEYGQKLDIGR
jgi:hypothetical protein